MTDGSNDMVVDTADAPEAEKKFSWGKLVLWTLVVDALIALGMVAFQDAVLHGLAHLAHYSGFGYWVMLVFASIFSFFIDLFIVIIATFFLYLFIGAGILVWSFFTDDPKKN